MKIGGCWALSILAAVLVGTAATDDRTLVQPLARNRTDQDLGDIPQELKEALLQDRDRDLADVADRTPRIVGGTNAGLGEFPYYVQGNGCGGSMIWKDIIITAAHCQGSPWQGNVIVGAYRFKTVSDGAESVAVSRQIIHPRWGGTANFHYDYMVVVLQRKASNINARNVVRLSPTRPTAGAMLTTIGMGVLQEDTYNFPSILQKVDVKYITARSCANNYYSRAKFGRDLIYQDTMICASSPGKDSCQGDSGGPILKPNGNLVGMVSWGIGCAESAYPGVYSVIPTVRTWINNQICAYSRAPPRRKCARRKRKRALARKLRGSFNATAVGCSDSAETFDVNRNTTDKDCAWLQTHRFSIDGEEDLCDWLHIASRCPNTCHSCDEFAGAW